MKLGINKNGSVAIGIIVILTMSLFVFLLYSVNTSINKIDLGMDQVYESGRMYAQKDSYENSIYIFALEEFLNSYYDVVSNYSLEKDMNKIFMENISVKINERVNKMMRLYDRSKSSFIFFLNNTNRGIVFDNETIGVVFSISSFSHSDKNKGIIDYEYLSKIVVNISFDKLSLPSFDDINKSYFICNKSDIDTRECLRAEFKNFNVSKIEEIPNTDYIDIKYKLSSKKNYFVNDKMKKMEFLLEYRAKNNQN